MPKRASELAQQLQASGKIPCEQCGQLFTPRNVNHIYHTQQCRLDHQNQRTAKESRAREQTGFAWDPIRPAAKVTVKVPKRSKPIFHVAQDWKTAVILPDQQFGYRRFLDDGALDPFHDPRAIDIAEQIVEAERPNKSVLLGDVFDLATWGRWMQEPEFVAGVQPGIDRGSVHIETVASCSDETIWMKGNHDQRLENSALNNALASAGIRRARRRPDEYPINTIEFFVGIADMPNVKTVGGYPAGAHYITESLACIHGRVTGSNIGQKVVNVERVTVVHGHTHGRYHYVQQFNNRGYATLVEAHSPGCLCRTDGHVPSVKSGRDPFGRPVTAWETWSQGVLVARYLESKDRFYFEDVKIFEGEAMHRGQIFTSKKAVDDPELDLIPASGKWIS